MGKKLDALFRRGFKVKKFKSTVNHAITRLAVLRNQHQSRCSVAMSDVTQILKLRNNERALIRAEQVVKEQAMLDVFNMIENYCYLLTERVSLLEHARECPDELKEGISSLIYAATRCGEFPELQNLRSVFASRFGKEFVDRASQLRNNCGVSPKIVQSLSTRMHTIESRMKVLKTIAMEHNIDLQVHEDGSVHLQKQEKLVAGERKEGQTETKKSTCPAEPPESSSDKANNDPEDMKILERVSDAMKMKGKYKDVAHAAQAAFESAAHAAAAARAAVELSWFDLHDSDDRKSPRKSTEHPINKVLDSCELIKSVPQHQATSSGGVTDLNSVNKLEKLNDKEKEALAKQYQSTESGDSEDRLKESGESSDDGTQDRQAIFGSSDYDAVDRGRFLLFDSHMKNKSLCSKTVHNEEMHQTDRDDNVRRNKKPAAATKSRNTYRR